MLDRCQAQADIEGLRIVTYCQPMQDLELPRSYRAIYLAGPTFNLLLDDETARRTLQGIADHLEPGGQAMVPLWMPPATAQQEFGRTREAGVAGGMTARYTIESEDYDEAGRIRCSHTRYELASSGHTEAVRRDWIIHWHSPSGFTELAQDAGLVVKHLTRREPGVHRPPPTSVNDPLADLRPDLHRWAIGDSLAAVV